MLKEKKILLTEKFLSRSLGAFCNSIKDGDFHSPETYQSKHFYEGTKRFLKNPSKNGKWSLGYAKVNLTPDDYRRFDYYLGGYIVAENKLCNRVEDVIDDMCGRAIALDDGSGRGISLFCTVDCIGLTNADIRTIRTKFEALFAAEFPQKKLASVNIFSTHTHSCVDTEGLWTDFPFKMLRNYKRKITGHGALERGADEQYIRFLTTAVSQTLLRACRDMCPGELYFAQKELSNRYFANKNRPSATSILTLLTKLEFIPDDNNKKPTLIVNMPAHPDVAGLATSDGKGTGRELCGDYIHYMDETAAGAGYNLAFFNGAICAIYMSRGLSNDDLPLKRRYEESERFGVEIAKIALGMTKTLDEIKANKALYDEKQIARETERAEANGGRYTLWCENWQPVSEKKVAPLLNIRLKEVKLPITNPLICAMGKLNLANFDVIKDGKNSYSIVTEIGYIEFGKELKIAMVPGEYCCDLLMGGESLKASGSFLKTDFPYPTLREILGENTIAFGLANDAIGYIVPDNDYTLGDPGDHYHEFVSVGKYAGSCVNKAFCDLKNEL